MPDKRNTPPYSFACLLAAAGIRTISFRERPVSISREREGPGWWLEDDPSCLFAFDTTGNGMLDERVMTFRFTRGLARYYECLGTESGLDEDDGHPVVIEGPAERFTIRGFGLERDRTADDGDEYVFTVEVEVAPKREEEGRVETVRFELDELWKRTGLWKKSEP